MPSDGKGAKGGDVMTKTHATGAASQYGMRYLLKMIFNVAIGEDDNDGNGNVHNDAIPAEDLAAWLAEIGKAETLEVLKKVYQEKSGIALRAGDQKTVLALMEAKDARKAELA
jgi:hypothetical protein